MKDRIGFSFMMQRDPGSNPDLIGSFEIKQAKLQQNLTAVVINLHFHCMEMI